MKRLKSKLTFSNCVACLSLFFALGGVGYAAMKLPANSVGSAQLKNGAVTPSKLSKQAQARFAGGPGPAGPQGAPGPKGDPGPAGATDPGIGQRLAALEAENKSLAERLDGATARVAALEGTFAGVTREGTTLKFSGMNLQVLSGAGSQTATNGLGNVIIGYDEEPAEQSGSNNLVMGTVGQGFDSTGGILGGLGNFMGGEDQFVSGAENEATGAVAAIVGGDRNKVLGSGATAVSGVLNEIGEGAAFTAAVGGTGDTLNTGHFGVTIGGARNEVTGEGAVAAAGSENTAAGQFSFARGGHGIHLTEIWEAKP
ncbi:MAG TPA: hypothetical protein VHA80_13235 [Solirubrobacterales bacterium]|nr:hypothetical protein [Solirubrobacterales bacterium]